MPAKKKAVAGNAQAKATAPVIDMAAVLAQLQSLTERVSVAENENQRLQAALAEAKETGSFVDEMGNKVNCLSEAQRNTNAGMHDRPGTLIETLDVMEKQAKIRREPFDRERTRKILSGEEVEDLSQYICDRCGRSEAKWNTHPEMFEAHVQHHITGKAQAYRGARKIRAVDAEDDEDAERALFEKLSAKYGIVREVDSGLTVGAVS
jgi:hypothetical protein